MSRRKIKLHSFTISRLEKLSRKKKIICFGSGNNLTHLFDAMRDLRMEDRISYIVDNDPTKWGKSRILNGRSILMENPEHLRVENWDENILLIAIVAYHVILKQLDELLEGTKAVCLISPRYRYRYDEIFDKLTLRQPLRKALVLQGEGDTCENAKALIQEFRKYSTYKDYKIAWLCEKTGQSETYPTEIFLLRNMPLKKHTVKQIYDYYQYLNRAGYLIYENKMIAKARKEQTACYMNHGTPLKSTKGKIQVYPDTDYVVTTSEHTVDIICEQYEARKDQILICGTPRTDCLFVEKIDDRMADELQLSQYERMILWAPTFRVHENYSRRDSEKEFRFGIPLLEQEADYQAVVAILKEKNVLLVVKPHIHEELTELTLNETTHIRIVKQELLDRLDSNVYELMKLADALITDYSSIAFDYMLLNRPIGYTIDDMEQYTIGFSVPDPLAYMPGTKMKTSSDLLDFIGLVSQGHDDYIEEREKVRDRLYRDQDGKNSERLLRLLGLAEKRV